MFSTIAETMGIINNVITRQFNSIKDMFDKERLDERMKNIVNNKNDKCYYGYKPVIISLNSKELLNNINHLTSFTNKVSWLEHVNIMLFQTSKNIYERYNPDLIYTFGNEINVVFYNNENGIYNNNINKTITSLSSYASVEMSNRFKKNKMDIDVYFTAKFIEFDQEYEVLNYLIWRQIDCKRNTITLLYKCLNVESILEHRLSVEGMKIDQMVEELNRVTDTDIENVLYHLLTGNIIKKYLTEHIYDRTTKQKFCRTCIKSDNFRFSDDFKGNYEKYILTKVLDKK